MGDAISRLQALASMDLAVIKVVTEDVREVLREVERLRAEVAHVRAVEQLAPPSHLPPGWREIRTGYSRDDYCAGWQHESGAWVREMVWGGEFMWGQSEADECSNPVLAYEPHSRERLRSAMLEAMRRATGER